MSTPQPQQQSNAPLTVAAVTAALIALYAAADHMLLSGVGWILRRTNYSMAGRRQIRALSQRVASELEQATGPLIDQLVSAAVEDAGQTIPTQQVTDAAVEAAAEAEQTVEHIVAGVPSAPADAEHVLTVDERPTFPVEPGNAFITPPPAEPPKPPKSLVPSNWFDSYKDRAVQAVRDDLTSELQDVRRRITRLDDDVYKMIAPQYAINLIQGGITPQEAAAGAWKQFVRQGITGFTDKACRNWALSTYVEMAVRTATMRAYLEATVQSMDMAGVNLATVPHDAHPCPKCFPWQGRIIAIHPDGVHPTMDDARKAGLWHPQCGHALIRWDPSIPPPREWTRADQAAYQVTQKQRALELAVRKAKRMIEYGQTAAQRAEGRQDMRDAQKQLRKLSAQSGLPRRSYREQPDLRYSK